MRKVLLGNSGINYRHFAMNTLADAFELGPDQLHARFRDAAPNLAAAAAQQAIQNAATRADEIDALIVSTCTGYLCPGLTSYVSELVGLNTDIGCYDLVGQGCGAALPNLTMAEALLESGKAGKVLSICVEICSAAFFLDDDPGVLISACLFGDGAGAVILSAEPGIDGPKIEWIDHGTRLDTGKREALKFETVGGMLRNVLDKSVPALAAEMAHSLFNEMAAKHGFGPGEIQEWVIHAGGRDVLNALEGAMGLGPEALQRSRHVLEEYGNVSSASVLFALKAAMRDSPRPGWWWMSSFGAGMSCHSALLRASP